MKSFIHALVGGVAIILVATVIGVAHNAIRSNPIQLIQRAPEAPLADRSGDGEGDTDTAVSPGAVALDEMKQLYDEGMTVILDARGPGEYAEGHIPGAVNIPYDELAQYLETLQSEAPMDLSVVCYCRGLACDLSDHLATELRMMGYADVKVYKGGWDGWTEAGHPVVTGTEP